MATRGARPPGAGGAAGAGSRRKEPLDRLPDEIHPRAAAMLAGVPREELPPVSVVGEPAETPADEGPYPDDASYLEHQLLRLRAVVEGAVALSGGDATGHALARAREQ